MSTNGAQDEDRLPTERVILERIRALRVPDEVTDEQLAEALKDLPGFGPRGKRRYAVEEAWAEVARNTAASKRAAIRAHAGEPGTPDAKVGTFRAPPLRSWKDAEVYEAPPKPLVTARTVE